LASAASVAAASSASCRGCQVTLLDFAAITADDDRIRDFLMAHRVIAGDSCFEACHDEYGVDLRRKLFRCDRQVSLTFILHGGVPRSQQTFVLKQIDNG